MKYPHCVKHNGIYYPAGAEVPAGTSPKAEEKRVEEKSVVAEVKTEKAETKKAEVINESIGEFKITDTKIRTMKAEDAKNLAYSLGLEFQPDSTNQEIKTMLRHYYGLDKR